jgi:hypothetical protein
MLIGSCDDLSTPRMLGPFRDLAPAVGPRLAAALQAGEPDLVMDALLDELHRPPPSTLVIEDVHWADEATVDTLRPSWYAGASKNVQWSVTRSGLPRTPSMRNVARSLCAGSCKTNVRLG